MIFYKIYIDFKNQIIVPTYYEVDDYKYMETIKKSLVGRTSDNDKAYILLRC